MCFSPKLVPAATWGVWGRLPTLQLLWGLNENQMGNLSVRACSTPIPSLISTVLRTALYNWKAPGKFCTVSDEDKVGAWKRGEQHPVTPRSKEVRTQRGSCPAGEGSCLEWPRSLSIATQWASLFSNRRSPSLLLHSRAPWGIRLRLQLQLFSWAQYLQNLVLCPTLCPTTLRVSPETTLLLTYLHKNPHVKLCFQGTWPKIILHG